MWPHGPPQPPRAPGAPRNFLANVENYLEYCMLEKIHASDFDVESDLPKCWIFFVGSTYMFLIHMKKVGMEVYNFSRRIGNGFFNNSFLFFGGMAGGKLRLLLEESGVFLVWILFSCF